METLDLVSVVAGMGLLAPGESAAVCPLTGGVSSDIAEGPGRFTVSVEPKVNRLRFACDRQ